RDGVTLVHTYHDTDRASTDRRTHGKASAQGAQGAGRIPRSHARRPARGHRPSRLRGQGTVRSRVGAADRRTQGGLRTRAQRRARPQAGRDAVGDGIRAKEEITGSRLAMSDDDLVRAFEACAIGATEFHHADHVRLAWIYLRRCPLVEAIERFTVALKRFAAHHGVPGRYHETITWAYLLLVHERMQRGDADGDWESFRE